MHRPILQRRILCRYFASSIDDLDLIAKDSSIEMIYGYTPNGFTVDGGMRGNGMVELYGSIFVTKKSSLLWTPKRYADINIDSLILATLIRPKIDILVIGCGKSGRRPDAKLQSYFQTFGIALEMSNTVHLQIHTSKTLS